MKKLFLTGMMMLASTMSLAAFDGNAIVAIKNFELDEAASGNCPNRIKVEFNNGDLYLKDSENSKQLSLFTSEQLKGEARADLDGKQTTITTKHSIKWKRKTEYSVERSSLKFKNGILRVTENSRARSYFGVNAELEFDCFYRAE
jgi:hypothetical protein